jgi:C1A family cysteine protease
VAESKETQCFFGWRPELPDHRDLPYKLMQMPYEAPPTLPTRVDLRPLCPPVYNQLALGSCTANAIGGLFQFDRLKQGLPDFVPSRLFIYFNERVMEDTVNEDAGAFIRDGIKSVAEQGVCKEDIWPYVINHFRDRPIEECYTQAEKYQAVSYYRIENYDIYQLKSCLAAGFPFVFGFTVFNSFMIANTNGGFVPMPGYESQLGGHAVMCVGYDDANNCFIIRNSWGDDVGDRGYYYMPYPYLTTGLSSDFWTIRLVSMAQMVNPG